MWKNNGLNLAGFKISLNNLYKSRYEFPIIKLVLDAPCVMWAKMPSARHVSAGHNNSSISLILQKNYVSAKHTYLKKNYSFYLWKMFETKSLHRVPKHNWLPKFHKEVDPNVYIWKSKAWMISMVSEWGSLLIPTDLYGDS